MKLNLLSILLSTGIFSFAQYTYVPDDYFEYELMNLGLDDIQDDYVLTANINQITTLEIPYKNIADLTGIEGFTALKELNCSNNYLNELDVTQNLALEVLHASGNQLTDLNVTQNNLLFYLRLSNNELTTLDTSNNPLLNHIACNSNSLTSLDVTQNPLLVYLICFDNQISNLNLENNAELKYLTCQNNQLTGLDISNNPLIETFYCSDNQLTVLDLRNRDNIYNFYFEAINNPNLMCIDVDNLEHANNHWDYPNRVDEWANFSLDCANMSVVDEELNKISLYPNPTKNSLNFSENLREFTIYDLSGKLILKGNGLQTNVSNLSNGTYLLNGISNSGKTINQKFIKN